MLMVLKWGKWGDCRRGRGKMAIFELGECCDRESSSFSEQDLSHSCDVGRLHLYGSGCPHRLYRGPSLITDRSLEFNRRRRRHPIRPRLSFPKRHFRLSGSGALRCHPIPPFSLCGLLLEGQEAHPAGCDRSVLPSHSLPTKL